MNKKLGILIVIILALSLTTGFTGKNEDNSLDYDSNKAYIEAVLKTKVDNIDSIGLVDIRNNIGSAEVVINGEKVIYNLEKSNKKWEITNIK